MSLTYQIVQPVRLRADCPCGGEFKANGKDDLTNDRYGHRCDDCGQEMYHTTKFPTIEHFTEAELSALVGK